MPDVNVFREKTRGVRSKPYDPLPQNNTDIKIQGESRTERGIE